MESEIDLRPYVNVLVRHWWIVITSGIIFGILALVVSLSRPSAFQATALVAFLEPTQAIQFDPRIETLNNRATLLKSLPDLSKSDQMLSDLLAQADFPEIETISDLESRLDADSGSDLNLLYLRAKDKDPEVAARLVNLWADLFINVANEIYTDRGSSQLDFFNGQLTDATTRLQATEEALVDFQTTNRLVTVTNELASLTLLQANYLEYDTALDKLQNDIQAMRTQQEQLPSGVPSIVRDYSLLALQSKILNLQKELPFSIEINPNSELTPVVENQAQYLNSLESIISTMKPIVADQLFSLEPRILGLQREKERLTSLLTRLTTDRDLALETYKTLVRKLDEERLTTEDDSTGFKQVSRASVPVEPINKNHPMILFVGVAFGIVLSALAIILFAWWRSE